MNQTFKLILITLLSFFSLNGFGQDSSSKTFVPQITLFAEAGIKQLSFNNLTQELNKVGAEMPLSSYFIGASTYFNSEKMIFGLEFNNSFGSVNNGASLVTHNGLSAGGQVGYKVYQNKSFTLAPIIGFSTVGNKVSVVDEVSTQNNNARIYKNNNYALKGGIFFEYITPVNTSFGIKAGYDFSLNQQSEWEIIGSDIKTDITDRIDGFFISLIIGGHVSLKHH